MKSGPAAAALLAALLAGTACRSGRHEASAQADSTELVRREAHLAGALAQPDSGEARGPAIARWLLGRDLSEISGLALTADGRLLAHGDEEGEVSEIDYRRGLVVKRFSLGTQPVHADFEGITVANDVVYLLASNGKLYEFQEGSSGQQVAYRVHDTGLKHECEFEGVAFDPKLNALLLLCKNVRTKGALQDSLVIYRWSLTGGSGAPPSRLTMPLAQIIGANGWKGLHPSDITIDPVSGDYVLVAAEERALIDITPTGKLVFARPLPASLEHTEGVAITPDGLLILSDEAGHHPAEISLYRWR
jgi:uncharacterized protein YjiK